MVLPSSGIGKWQGYFWLQERIVKINWSTSKFWQQADNMKQIIKLRRNGEAAVQGKSEQVMHPS